jgi:hypothetical protein
MRKNLDKLIVSNTIREKKSELINVYADAIASITHEAWYLKELTDLSPRQIERVKVIEKSIENIRLAFLKTEIDIYPSEKTRIEKSLS